MDQLQKNDKFNWDDLPRDLQERILGSVWQEELLPELIPKNYWQSKDSVRIDQKLPDYSYKISIVHHDNNITNIFSASQFKECGLSTNSKLVWYTHDKEIYVLGAATIKSNFEIKIPCIHLIDGTQEQFVLYSGTQLELYQAPNYSKPIATYPLPSNVKIQAMRFNKDQSRIALKSTDNHIYIYAIKKRDTNINITRHNSSSLNEFLILKENLKAEPK